MARRLDWAAMARRAWGAEFSESDVVYEFGNRKFKDSRDGVYAVPVFLALLLEDQRAGLDFNDILLEDGGKLGNG